MHTYIHAIFGVWAHTYNQKILKYMFFFLFRKKHSHSFLFCFSSLFKTHRQKNDSNISNIIYVFLFFLFGSHFSFQRGRGAGSSRKTTERPEVRTHALYKSTSLLKYPIVINNNNNNWGEQRVMFFFLLLIIFHDKNKIKRKWN